MFDDCIARTRPNEPAKPPRKCIPQQDLQQKVVSAPLANRSDKENRFVDNLTLAKEALSFDAAYPLSRGERRDPTFLVETTCDVCGRKIVGSAIETKRIYYAETKDYSQLLCNQCCIKGK